MRIRSVTLLVVGSLMVLALPAAAAPPETFTIIEHDVVETFSDVVPSCEGGGPLYQITTTSNQIDHVTEFGDGRVHATFTDTGTFVATHPTLPDASGHFTAWGGFNDNGGALNGTFTFNVQGKFEDGSRFKFHSTDHFNETPSGAEFFFTHCHD